MIWNSANLHRTCSCYWGGRAALTCSYYELVKCTSLACECICHSSRQMSVKCPFALLSDQSSFSSTSISATKLRTLRANIVSAKDGGAQRASLAAITSSADFYSTSGFRDMMAHPVVSCNANQAARRVCWRICFLFYLCLIRSAVTCTLLSACCMGPSR